MEILVIKILSGLSLWLISIFFGILMPYFIWHTSRSRHHCQNRRDHRSSSVRLVVNETVNLIRVDDEFGYNKSYCLPCKNCTKRLLNWLKVVFGNGVGLSLANCICGGVFLGVCLLDLIPQSRSDIDDIMKKMNISSDFPVSEFAISIGLLVIMTAENAALQFCMPHREQKSKQTKKLTNTDSALESDTDILIESADTQFHDKEEIAVYRNYILAATLSLHSIFEGLAIGLQSNLATLVQLLIAITVHKAVLTFGIGLRLFETLGGCNKLKAAIICAFIFCTASPIGVAIGTALAAEDSVSESNQGRSSAIASAILQCLATGTFLYVTFVEVIPNEFSHSDQYEKQNPNNKAESEGTEQPSFPTSSNGGNEVNVENNENLPPPTLQDISSASHQPPQKRLSRITKLISLIFGFIIATAVQCL